MDLTKPVTLPARELSREAAWQLAQILTRGQIELIATGQLTRDDDGFLAAERLLADLTRQACHPELVEGSRSIEPPAVSGAALLVLGVLHRRDAEHIRLRGGLH